MPSRRTRRRLDRERARRPPRQTRRMSVLARIGFVLGGCVLIAAGIAVLAVEATSPAGRRLGRLAGIFIVVGIALVAVAVLNTI